MNKDGYGRTILGGAVLLCLTCFPVRAQEAEFLPDIDAHLKLSSMFRMALETTSNFPVSAGFLISDGKWSTMSLHAGCLFPVGKHVQFNTYYEHDNNTGKQPNQAVNSAGLAMYLYFSAEKK